MSLVADYGNSGSSTSSDSEEDLSDHSGPHFKKHFPKTPVTKLPKPAFDDSSQGAEVTSVFSNRYKKEEIAKTAILEKHVKMVDTQENVRLINGKKICWNYRKGRCRFGHNCKYAHDSDIQKSQDNLDTDLQLKQTVICENKQTCQHSLEELKQFQSEAAKSAKKRRPGLSQTLVPGKKVMKMYYNTKK